MSVSTSGKSSLSFCSDSAAGTAFCYWLEWSKGGRKEERKKEQREEGRWEGREGGRKNGAWSRGEEAELERRIKFHKYTIVPRGYMSE